MYFTFKALAGKLNLDKECVPNFALFEIMDYGFGKSNVATCKRDLARDIVLCSYSVGKALYFDNASFHPGV